MGFLERKKKSFKVGEKKKVGMCLVHREPFLFPFVAEESMEFI